MGKSSPNFHKIKVVIKSWGLRLYASKRVARQFCKSLIYNKNRPENNSERLIFDPHIWRIWVCSLADRPFESTTATSCTQDIPTIHSTIATISIGEHYMFCRCAFQLSGINLSLFALLHKK